MKLLTIEDALPCPFCGNETIRSRWRPSEWELDGQMLTKALVYCSKETNGCNALIERMGADHEHAIDLAVRAWNRRTP